MVIVEAAIAPLAIKSTRPIATHAPTHTPPPQGALNALITTPLSPNDLRHTCGTAMATAGVPMRTLQEWMGHRDIQTTQQYADYAPRVRDAELVAAAFASQGVTGLAVEHDRIT